MRLLISTPRRLFVYDVHAEALRQIRSGDGEYYGISWSADAAFLSHSYVDNEKLLDLRGAPESIHGDVAIYAAGSGEAVRTRRRQLVTHQIEWVEDRLLVIDTGHERISSYRADGTLIADTPLGGLTLDRGAVRGHHFNSVHHEGCRIWVVAHNHARTSEVWELSWPELERVRTIPTGALWAHNIWIGERGMVICDSGRGALHDVVSGSTVWTAGEPEVISRGLVANDQHVIVGRSQFANRGSRNDNDGGIWILDRATLRTLDRRVFPGSGCINDIRLLDGPDECHNGIPFDELLLTRIANARDTLSIG